MHLYFFLLPTEFKMNVLEKLELIINVLEGLGNSINEIRGTISTISVPSTSSSDKFKFPVNTFPIKTIERVSEFNKFLEDNQSAKNCLVIIIDLLLLFKNVF
jgi:hypothetical protein